MQELVLHWKITALKNLGALVGSSGAILFLYNVHFDE